MTDVSRQRVLTCVGLLVFVLVAGTAGYALLGGRDVSVMDAFYMTVITLSTVGFREVVPVSGRPVLEAFTVILIFTGVGTAFYILTTVTTLLVEGELLAILGRKRMDRRIETMKNHYIVCGGGEIGTYVVEELLATGRKVVLIEKDKERLEEVLSGHDVPFVEGDATSEEVLLKAGIERCSGVIFALPEDRDNLLGVITARSLNPSVRIVTKGVDPAVRQKMIKVGASAVVYPERIGGLRLASEMIRPTVVDFLDGMLRAQKEGAGAIRIEEIRIPEGSPLEGKTVVSSALHSKTGFLVVAVKEKEGGRYLTSPSPERPFKAGDVLIVMGDATRLDELRSFVGSPTSREVSAATLREMTSRRDG